MTTLKPSAPSTLIYVFSLDFCRNLSRTSHTIVTSEYILSEVKEKLIHKVHLPRSISLAIIDYLREITKIFKPEHVDTHKQSLLF